jgi:hypothetical protein
MGEVKRRKSPFSPLSEKSDAGILPSPYIGEEKIGERICSDLMSVAFVVLTTEARRVSVKTSKENKHMSTTNAERLQAYKAKMEVAGFKRLSVYVHSELAAFLARERYPHECGGRTLERLLLGHARPRPPYR